LHGSGDRPGRCPAPSAAQDAQQVADRPAVEALLHLRDLLCLENVELHDPLGGLELADLHRLARLVRIAEVVGERDLVDQRPEVAALQHPEIGLGKLELRIVGDVVRAEFLRERRVVALDLARNHDQLRTSFPLVHVIDGLVGRYVGSGIRLLRRGGPGGRRRITERRLRRNVRAGKRNRRAEDPNCVLHDVSLRG
jgi:hypothetical protein